MTGVVASDWWPVTRAGVGLAGVGGHRSRVMGMPAVMAMQSTQAPHALLAVPGKAGRDGVVSDAAAGRSDVIGHLRVELRRHRGSFVH